jgi:hypothetical protein
MRTLYMQAAKVKSSNQISSLAISLHLISQMCSIAQIQFGIHRSLTTPRARAACAVRVLSKRKADSPVRGYGANRKRKKQLIAPWAQSLVPETCR